MQGRARTLIPTVSSWKTAGIPEGIAICCRGYVNLLPWAAEICCLNPSNLLPTPLQAVAMTETKALIFRYNFARRTFLRTY